MVPTLGFAFAFLGLACSLHTLLRNRWILKTLRQNFALKIKNVNGFKKNGAKKWINKIKNETK
jgi:hypothetical protein